MTQEEKRNIVRGLVYYKDRWIPIERKIELESQRKKCIEKGFVRFQGEWITIEEKLARVTPPAQREQQHKQVVVNKTINRQVYNIQSDNRSFNTSHEHRHLHVEQDAFVQSAQDGQIGSNKQSRQVDGITTSFSLQSSKKELKALKKKKRLLLKEPQKAESSQKQGKSSMGVHDADEFLD